MADNHPLASFQHIMIARNGSIANDVHFRPVIAQAAKSPWADCLAAIAFVYFSLTFRTGSTGELREWM
jgi:hypothetical protein